MTIRFLCPMGHPLAVPDNRAGKKGRCPVCRQRVVVPRPAGGTSLSDEEVADLLGMPDDDEDDEGDESADEVRSDEDAPDMFPDAPRRRPPDPPSRKKDPSSLSRREPPARATKQKSGSTRATHSTDPPGDRHKWLAGLVGHWDFRLKVWLEPGETPSLSIGSAEAKWIMGQRFLQIKSQGTLLDATFGSLWTLGYDNVKQAYVSLYLDDRSTGFYLAEGQAATDGETLQLFGAMHDWIGDQRKGAYLYTIRQIHAEQWKLELQDVLRDEAILEIVYSRKS